MKKDYPDIQALENEKWQDPDPATGKLGTRVPAKWLQLVEDSSKSLTLEILEVLKEAKIEPNELKNTQLKDAIVAIAAARIINWKDVQNAPKILDVLGDSKVDGASQRIVNTVNKLAKDAMTAANLANDKANEAKQGAYEADQKATAAQKKADQVPDPVKDNFIVGNDKDGYKLMTAAQVKALLAIPQATKVVNETGDSATDAISQQMFTEMSFAINSDYRDFTNQRVNKAVYTNNTRKPLLVIVGAVQVGSGHHPLIVTRKDSDSEAITTSLNYSTGASHVTVVIPAGWQYWKETGTNILLWVEI